MGSARGLLRCGLMIAVATQAPRARATTEERSRIFFDASSCKGVALGEVTTLLKLYATVVDRDDLTAVGVRLTCLGETLVVTACRSSDGGRPLRRRIHLDEVSEASRARLVALAVTELAIAYEHANAPISGRQRRAPSAKPQDQPPERRVRRLSRVAPEAVTVERTIGPVSSNDAVDPSIATRGPALSESAPASPAQPPPKQPNDPLENVPADKGELPAPTARSASPPIAPARHEPREDSGTTGVLAVRAPSPPEQPLRAVLLGRGGAEIFPRAFGSTASGGVRLSLDGVRAVGLTLDAQASTARVSVSAGSVVVSSFAFAPAVHARLERGRWSGRVGLGPKLGLGVLSGAPSAPPPQATGSTFSGLWAGVSSFAALRVRAAGPLMLELSTEGGMVISPLAGTVDDRREVAIDGPWVSVFAAAGVSL